MALVACLRVDIIGGFLLLWISIFILLKRSTVRIIWPIFSLYLGISFIAQYAMAIGLPVEWCIGIIFYFI